MSDPAETDLQAINLRKKISFWTKTSKWVPNHTPEHLFFRLVDSAQGCDLALIFGNLNHNKKLSEIMPPTYQINVGKQLIHFSEMIFL